MTKPPQSNLGAAGWVAASLFVWAATMIVSRRVLDSGPSSAALRGLMVAVALAGFLLWVAALVRFLRTLDEFSRRVQLISVAVAFGAMVTALVAADFLQAAGFLGYVPLDALWMLMIVLWWVSMIAVSRVLPMKNRLRVLRAEFNWSQTELGMRVGVSRQAINAIETGKVRPEPAARDEARAAVREIRGRSLRAGGDGLMRSFTYTMHIDRSPEKVFGRT